MAMTFFSRAGCPRPGRLTAAALLLFCAAAAARASTAPDSLSRLAWGAVYSSTLDIRRESGAFPWNDEEDRSHFADRFAAFAQARPAAGLALFAKGATGVRLEGWDRENRFSLDQAHASFSSRRARIEARLFLRERVFRSDHRLTAIVSDESPFLEGRGEGLAVSARPASVLRIRYLESYLRDGSESERAGGAPIFHGGVDVFRALRAEASAAGRLRAGVFLSQVRSIAAGDAITVGVDLEGRVRGARLIAELARSHRGVWSDLRGSQLFDLDFAGFDADGLSGVFSENDAFSAQLEGLEADGGRLGGIGVVPAFRFVGEAFANPQGETTPGEEEASVLAWWRPPESDALVTVEGADGKSGGAACRRIAAGIRLRFRGGFELEGRGAAAEGARPSFVASFLSDTGLARTLLVSRIDDFGDRNRLALLARSSIRIAGSVTATGALYLFDSRTTRYSAGFEFRPGDRVLLAVAGGSISPGFEAAAMRFGAEPPTPPEERSLVVSGRFSFGGMQSP